MKYFILMNLPFVDDLYSLYFIIILHVNFITQYYEHVLNFNNHNSLGLNENLSYRFGFLFILINFLFLVFILVTFVAIVNYLLFFESYQQSFIIIELFEELFYYLLEESFILQILQDLYSYLEQVQLEISLLIIL